MMKIASLTGPPIEVKDYILISRYDINFFWHKNRLSEARTGILVCKGSLKHCEMTLTYLIATKGIDFLKNKIDSSPSVYEIGEMRKELLRLHQQWRRITRSPLKRKMNCFNVAGDLYVEDFPEAENARLRMIIKKIKKIQERSLR